MLAQVLLRARQYGINTTSFRIGQITGNADNGAWALTDWVPIMIKSSITMGHLPSTPGVSRYRGIGRLRLYKAD
jgi:thioester reductase-like protein